MAILKARSFISLCAAAILSTCGQATESPQRGVDTTLPDNPGKLTGSLSFPSDYIPKDLRVCAEAVAGSEQYCSAQISGDSYVLEVPEGEYRVFAQTAEMPGQRAYYSEFVECGYYSWCPSHEPVKVKIEEGETRNRVNPGDWYVQQRSEPAEDGETYDNAGTESATNDAVEDDGSSAVQETEPTDTN